MTLTLMARMARKRWRRREQAMLFERLESYISAGISLDKALELSREGIPPRRSTAIAAIHGEVVSGSPLYRSLEKNIGMPKSASSLIEHGEASGKLSVSLGRARRLLETEDEMLKKCFSAMAYPAVIAVFSMILTIALVRGVLPQITPMLKGLHVQLPLLTNIVIAISDYLASYGVYSLIFVSVSIVLISLAYKRSDRLKELCHAAVSGVPVVGRIARMYSLSLFMRSCGSLVESGTSVARSYSSAMGSVPLMPLRKKLMDRLGAITSGVPIGPVLANLFRSYPTYIAPLIFAGEASGTLGASFTRCADIIDSEIDHSLKRLTSLLEPVMMAGMGVVVGAIALSIMMPIYDISKALQH